MSVKITTGLVRFSYVHVWQPKEDKNGNLKYSVALLFPKKNKNALKAIQQAYADALQEGKDDGTFGKKDPKKVSSFKWGLRDGDEDKDEDENYEDMLFVNASSKYAPLVGDADRIDIVDEEDFYSGCWGRASIVVYPYNHEGNMGIGCELHSVQKLRDGEKLGGRASLDSAFAEDIDEEELSIIDGLKTYVESEDDDDDIVGAMFG